MELALLDRIQAITHAIETAAARELAASDPDCTGDLVVLDDVTPRDMKMPFNRTPSQSGARQIRLFSRNGTATPRHTEAR